MKRLLALVLLVLAPTARSESIDLGTRGTIDIDLPKGWSVKTVSDPRFGSSTLVTAPEGTSGQLQLTMAFSPKEAPTARTDVDDKVLMAADTYVAMSVEQKKTLHPFHLQDPYAYGSYCIFTDKSLAKGEGHPGVDFRVAAAGLVWFSPEVSMSVIILADDEADPAFAAMLRAVASAQLRTPPSA